MDNKKEENDGFGFMVTYMGLNIIGYIAVVWWFNTGFEWIFWTFASFLAIPIQIFLITGLLYGALCLNSWVVKKLKKKQPTEYIVCSALNYNGTIVSGISQSSCIQAIINLKENPDTKVINNNQGFLTSTGRFVDRMDAWDIAIANNQIKYLKDEEPFKINGRPLLMSIHLYDKDVIYR